VSDPNHFAAFSFVDRISDFTPGRRASGAFAIPPGVDAFPPCLMAESVGQLAAWIAMSHIGFRGRPVAALATETRFLRQAKPGDVLDLHVDIHDVDDDAVAYQGHADIRGERAIELVDCLGPMLPLEDFDDPRAMAERFALLVDGGASPHRFPGVQRPAIVRDGNTARLDVPQRAAFFDDHFPRRNVFPATLMLDAQIELALAVARETWPDAAAVRMTNVKVRSFTAPGTQLMLAAERREAAEREATFHLSAHADGKPVATARVVIARGLQ
jgi:3-hydroxymyristoyl/3-hydroxydecanoyl-(acyl carrier protein) dehydratase